MEICEICQVNRATIHLTQLDNEQVTVRHYCQECAEENGLTFISSEQSNGEDNDDDFESEDEYDEDDKSVSLEDLLMGEATNQGAKREVYCPKCETSESQFRKTLVVGCSKCYEIFNDSIKGIIKSSRGTNVYRGKKYAKGASSSFRNELDCLRDELDEAISAQKFEVASVLRDRIIELEKIEVR